MDFSLDFIEGLVNRIGLPVSISIIGLWIVTDIYLTFKRKIVKHLEKQTETSIAIVDIAGNQVKVLESMQADAKAHHIETHDYILECRIGKGEGENT